MALRLLFPDLESRIFYHICSPEVAICGLFFYPRPFPGARKPGESYLLKLPEGV